jgi:hypothetical protein
VHFVGFIIVTQFASHANGFIGSELNLRKTWKFRGCDSAAPLSGLKCKQRSVLRPIVAPYEHDAGRRGG